MPQVWPNGKRKIKWEVDDIDFTKAFACQLLTGGRGRRYHNAIARVLLLQKLYQVRYRQYLSYRDGMHPDNGTDSDWSDSRRHSAKSLGQSRTVPSTTKHAPYPPRRS